MVEIAQLPPLILHPFSGGGSSEELLQGSRAALALQKPAGHSSEDEEELFRRLTAGRYQEIRMLIFLGKDLFRWMQQCVEFVENPSNPTETPTPEPSAAARPVSFREPRRHASPRVISEQSFAALIVESPPAPVESKLQSWGVSDRRAIFSRAIGINSLFSSPPPVETLSQLFLRNYHRYADHAYVCFQHLQPFQALTPGRFQFEMYASEEYARLLSAQWGSDEPS